MALRKLELMHCLFGALPEHTCGECCHIVCSWHGRRPVRKCSVYGVTHSIASDWAKKWVACGKWNQPYAGRPVIKLVRPDRARPEPKSDEPLEHQMSLWEEN